MGMQLLTECWLSVFAPLVVQQVQRYARLQIMYGIPFVVSVSIRVIKACFIIPLEIIIGFPLLKQMDKLYK